MRRIVIAYATAGIGHKKAASAVKKALDEMAPPDTEVTLIDALDYTNSFFKWSYLQAYLLMVSKLPLFWGLSYYLTDNFFVNLAVKWLRRLNNWLNSYKLRDYLARTKPDVVISTHFFATEVIADLKKRGLCKTHLITVVTDYRLHSWWISDFVDTYVVASADARDDLIRWKINPSRINILGIPVEPIFTKKLDRDAILNKLGLQKNIFTILVIGGGFGVGPIEGIVKAINEVSAPVQVIVICGHNEELARKMKNLVPSLKCKANMLGFVDNVYDYMEVSDVLISKSGGITVSESMAKDLPILVISPILGQETRNSGFMVKHGAALKLSGVRELKGVLEDLTSHPERLIRMKESIGAIKKPMACYDVARLAVEKTII